jgi:RNA polymerase sigma-70 factor (ECF subfamily)
MNLTDADLLARASRGDHDALTALLQACSPSLQADLASQLPQRWQSVLAVEDVLQETFTDAFLCIGSFVPHGEGAFTVWVRKLARNNLLEAIRALEADKRGGGKRPTSLAPAGDPHATLLDEILPAATQTTPSQHVMRQERRASLATAMAALPPRYRIAIQRYDLEGRSIHETAQELGCSPGGVHLVRNRAFQRLRALLADQTAISRPIA